MLLLGERHVRKALNLQDCLDINRKALISICKGDGVVPSRVGLPYPNNPNKPVAVAVAVAVDQNQNQNQNQKETETEKDATDWTLLKPAAYYGSDDIDIDISMGMKVVSVRANNPSNNLPLVPATIILVDPPSGIVKATVSGTYITVARTSAGPALAVQTFKPDVQHLVLFGAGAQAECHIELMELAIGRAIPRISIINRNASRGEALKQKLQRDGTVEVISLNDTTAVKSLLSQADVIAATTNATTPLWSEACELKDGCLITGIGSYTPEMQEIPEYVVNSSHVIIDTHDAMAVGDLKHLGSYDGSSSTTHPITLAGNAFMDPTTIGKTTKYIFYKAVGTAIQDVLTAEAVVKSAQEQGIGQEVDMS
jgi:ornithine cyclodeaminase